MQEQKVRKVGHREDGLGQINIDRHMFKCKPSDILCNVKDRLQVEGY